MATPPGILTPSFPPQLGIVNVTYLNQEMEEEVKDQFSTPLIITIITLACSLLLVAAIYGCCHQRFSQKKNQVRWEEGWDGHPETNPCPRGTSGRRGAPELLLCWWRPPCWCHSRVCHPKSQRKVPKCRGCFWDGDQGQPPGQLSSVLRSRHNFDEPFSTQIRPPPNPSPPPLHPPTPKRNKRSITKNKYGTKGEGEHGDRFFFFRLLA